jgi:hypothetical protein
MCCLCVYSFHLAIDSRKVSLTVHQDLVISGLIVLGDIDHDRLKLKSQCTAFQVHSVKVGTGQTISAMMMDAPIETAVYVHH